MAHAPRPVTSSAHAVRPTPALKPNPKPAPGPGLRVVASRPEAVAVARRRLARAPAALTDELAHAAVDLDGARRARGLGAVQPVHVHGDVAQQPPAAGSVCGGPVSRVAGRRSCGGASPAEGGGRIRVMAQGGKPTLRGPGPPKRGAPASGAPQTLPGGCPRRKTVRRV